MSCLYQVDTSSIHLSLDFRSALQVDIASNTAVTGRVKKCSERLRGAQEEVGNGSLTANNNYEMGALTVALRQIPEGQSMFIKLHKHNYAVARLQH